MFVVIRILLARLRMSRRLDVYFLLATCWHLPCINTLVSRLPCFCRLMSALYLTLMLLLRDFRLRVWMTGIRSWLILVLMPSEWPWASWLLSLR